LTGAADGVAFDLLPDGKPEQTAWTRPDSRDAFLAMDRDGNGSIDDSRELFGSATDQPPSTERDGFKALAVFDDNADKRLDATDRAYTRLVVWTDSNHNGASEPQELQGLSAAGISVIELVYHKTWREDRHGNVLRYMGAFTQRIGNREVARRVFDVLLVTTPLGS
jgi:hypothetical protein